MNRTEPRRHASSTYETSLAVAAACPGADASYGSGCFSDPAYLPQSYASRVYPRPGGRTWPAMTAAQERRWSTVDGAGIAP